MESIIKVLVVDDSAFARHVISKQIQTDARFVVADHAKDGREALEKIKTVRPDVVTLDIEMPNMDGLTALERIMAECPTPVVMLSTLTGQGTKATIRALELGAVDFFLKASAVNPTGMDGTTDLIAKLKIAARVKVFKPLEQGQVPVPVLKPRSKTRTAARRVVVIGSSTGGPRALYQLVPLLPEDLPAAVLVVQHMPPGFTKSLADRLDQLSAIRIKEAEAGDSLHDGHAYMAPGGYHMVLKNNGCIDLNQSPTVCGVRPAVDVTMASAVAVYSSSVTGVVLTGMGSDGTKGSGLIKQAGGYNIVEDESTCTIFGMPNSVIQAGNADYVYPITEIAGRITSVINRRERIKNHG